MTDNTQQARAAVTPEAIEAAAEAMEDAALKLIGSDLGTTYRNDIARSALEAAVPYMNLSRNALMDIIADAYGDKNQGHLSLKAADAILAAGGRSDG